MQDVPKIVRERLRTTPTLNHPDSDVLTAFAEHSLSKRERAGVLEHLARCGDCRDIVSLALPAGEQLQPAFKPSPRSWLTWPALRWGFIAGGVVAIASVSVVQYKHSQEEMAYRAPAPQAAEVKDEPASRAAPGSPAQTLKPAESRRREKPASGEANQSPPAEAPSPSLVASDNSGHALGGPVPLERFPHGAKMAMQWQHDAVQGQPAAPSSAPKLQGSDEVSAKPRAPSASGMVEAQAQAVQLEAQAAPQAPSSYDYASANIARAKPAAQPAPAPLPMQTFGRANLPSSGPAPRWTINSSGGLERSFDQGNTWQQVDVNGVQVPGSRLDAARTMAKANDADSGQQDAKKASAGSPIFRAVAANGAEVWAGGSSGALYHSIDAGNHWTRVVPGAAGTMLTGDITALEFPDSQHCRASTSTGEVWSSGDGGQTWQRQ